MPIKIEFSPEPFSEASLGGSPCLLADSVALSFLRREVRRYCAGEITGRSVLISGHRGSGKTTAVLKALLDSLLPESGSAQTSHVFLPLRPLFIPLLGEALLPDPDQKAPEAAILSAPDPGKTEPPAADGEKPSSPPTPASESKTAVLSDLERSLIQITLGLHRALTKEIIAAFRGAAGEGGHPTAPTTADRRAGQVELAELAGQLEIELDDNPAPDRLRMFWDKIGAIDRGVIPYTPFLNPITQDVRAHAPGRGARELVALVSSGEAFQRISAKITDERTAKEGAAREQSAGTELNTKDGEWQKPLVALLTGGLVGAGLYAAGAKDAGVGATFAGVLAAIGASLTFKFSSTRTASRSVSSARTLVRDVSVATLDRVLPILVDRVRAAGLAPIFVVDELDKVKDTRRISDTVRRLKKLVAENAFFCFLTDRDYFETVSEKIADGYSPEYTCYTHRLFVTYRPEDLHAYLNKVLTIVRVPAAAPGVVNPFRPDASQDATDVAATFSGATTSAVREAESREANKDQEDLDDRDVLRHVILHRARMHMVDIHRQIYGLISGESGGPNLLRPCGRLIYQAELTIQFAVEATLVDDELSKQIFNDPAFRRVANDALYYPSYCWAAGERALDLGPGGVKKFERHLRGRMGERDEPAKRKGRASPVGAHGADRLPPDLLRFLFATVRSVAALVANPSKLAAFVSNNLALFTGDDKSRVWEFLLPDHDAPLVLMNPATAPDSYEWRFNASGRRWTSPPAAHAAKVVAEAGAGTAAAPQPGASTNRVAVGVVSPPSAREAWVDDAKFLGKVQEEVAEFTVGLWDLGTLQSPWRVLPLSPSWTVARAARGRLMDWQLSRRDAAQAIGDEFADDIRNVTEFARMLRDYGRVIASALMCANAVGLLAGAGDSAGRRTYAGMNAIIEHYPLERLDKPGTEVVLKEITLEIQGEESFDSNLQHHLSHSEAPPLSDGMAWRVLLNSLASISAMPGDATLPVKDRAGALRPIRDRAWDRWEKRLYERLVFDGIDSDPPVVEELICSAAKLAPATLLRRPIGRMTLTEWTDLFLAWRSSLGASRDVPTWAAVVALRQLGFGGHLPDGVDALNRVLQEWPVAVPPSETENLNKWLRFAARDVKRRGLVVVRKAVDSCASGWEAGPLFAAAMFQEKLPEYPEVLTVLASVTEGVAVEDVTRMDDVSSTIAAERAKAGNAVKMRKVCFGTTGPARPPGGVEIIVGPKSLDDLFPPEKTVRT